MRFGQGIPLPVKIPILLLLLAAAAWVGARNFLQFRAIYPGGLTFVGEADGFYDTRYLRLFMWKPPDYKDPLPNLTLYVDSQPYPVEELTEKTVTTLGGTVPQGGIYDTAGNAFQYRFENKRLTWISLAPPFQPTTNKPTSDAGGNLHPGVFHVSVNGGPPFTLPVTLSELRAWAGPPEYTAQMIAD